MGSPEQEVDPIIGLELHGFVVTHALRSGGMGHVYEAKHPLIGHRVAVKVLRPELSGNSEVSARFLREARAMSAVKHRNIVEIHNFGQVPDGPAYMMMELIEGETLSEVIAREGPMKPIRALRLCEEVLAALVAAHAVGVVHRDLKPGNIVLMRESSGDLVLKVLDFGLARQLDAESAGNQGLDASPDDEARDERASVVAGTPEYISPEQAAGKPVDGKGDLYALGVMLFEMLSGRLPFESESGWELLELHRTAIPPLVSAFVPDVHPPLAAFVDQLLSKDPAKRAESAKATRVTVLALEEAILALPPVVTPLLGPVVRQLHPLPPPLPKPAPRFRAAGRAAGLAFIVGAASVLALSFTSSAASVQARPMPQQLDIPLPIPEPVAVIALADEPEIVPIERAEPTPLVPPPRKAPAVVQRKTRVKPALARAGAKPGCEANATWRQRLQQQLENLEQLSIAAIADTAHPSLVTNVKNRARTLSAAVSSAQDNGCAQVEAQVLSWKAALR